MANLNKFTVAIMANINHGSRVYLSQFHFTSLKSQTFIGEHPAITLCISHMQLFFMIPMIRD